MGAAPIGHVAQIGKDGEELFHCPGGRGAPVEMAHRLTADVEVLGDGQVGKDAAVLRHEAEPAPRDLEWLEIGDILVQKADPPTALRDQRHQCFEGGRLAGAVAAHERNHLPVPDVEGWLEQHLRGAIPRFEPLHLEHGRAHDCACAWGRNVRPAPR